MKYLIDLDGTLLDSRDRMFSLFEALTGAGRFTRDEYWAHKRTPTSHATLLREHLAFDEPAIADFERRWLDEIESPSALARDTVFEHVDGALAKLGAYGDLYVLTARQDPAAVATQLAFLGLADRFEAVLATGGGRTKEQTVRDAGLVLASDDALIGDTAEDIATAKALGIRAIAVTSGFRDAEYLRATGPDALHADIAEFAAVEVAATHAPSVSVAVVAYNQQHLIGECLDSILAQGFEDYEIVVADDGSTDDTQAVVRAYADRHPGRIVSVFAERNAGITANHNAALQACRGRYVAFIGGDDLMLPGKLAAQVAAMERDPDCNLCYHDLEIFSEATGETMGRFSQYNRRRARHVADLMRYGPLNGSCATMIRASAMPNAFDRRVPTSSDWLFYVETAIGGTIVYIDQVLGKYRRSDRSITRAPERQAELLEDHLVSCMILLARNPGFASELTHLLARYVFLSGRRATGLRRLAFFSLVPGLMLGAVLAWPLSRAYRAVGRNLSPARRADAAIPA